MELNEPLLNFWREFGDWGFILVLWGVIGEVVAAAIVGLINKRNPDDKPEHIKRWEDRLSRYEVLAGWILIIGLGMEYQGHKNETFILDADNAVLYESGKSAEERAGNANLAAQKASKDAETAKLQTAEIGITNALLSLRIEELYSTNLVRAKEVLEIANKLKEAMQIAIDARESVGDSNTVARLNETKATLTKAEGIAVETARAQEQVTRLGGKTDRGFTPEQFAYGTNFLSRFSNTKINMNTLFGDGECSNFREKLFGLLKSAGWEPHIGGIEGITSRTGDPLPKGFEIAVFNKDDLRAAAALSTFLDGCGLKSFLDAKNMKEGSESGLGSFVWRQ